ncbi:hypothetical protein QO179_24810 [Bacillus stercoris]|nr:hypothetical protein [Bacillus stercoris]
MKFRGLDFDPTKISESVTVEPKILPESKQAFQEATAKSGMKYLLPRIEAIHAGSTRNSTRYPADKLRGSEELKSGVYSWTKPYPKPVIYNHDVETEATGRIRSASFSEYTTAGRPGIIVVPEITSKKAVEDILEGRLLTVSIGATTDAAICSVCGTDIINEGFCGHYKGETYEGIKAEWICGNIWFDELSWVNVPADSDAMIVDSGELISTAESFGYTGAEVVNLGKSTSEWAVDPKIVVSEGLNPSKDNEKGDSTVTIEQIQEQVKELEKQKESLEQEKETLVKEKEELTGEVEQLKKDVEETTTAKEAVEKTLAETEAELASTKESLEEKESKVVELESTKESLEKALEEEKEAREEVVKENGRLSTEVHKMTAERVVDLRVSLGKESNREEAIQTYVARTTESLNDSLADLLKEAQSAPLQSTRQKAEQVANPGLNTDGKEQVSEGKVQLSAEDVLKNLFSGPGSKK